MTDAGMIRIALNGESREVSAGLTVASLVEELGRDTRTVAVEFNGEILSREKYASTELGAGDRLEVVHFVQGG